MTLRYLYQNNHGSISTPHFKSKLMHLQVSKVPRYQIQYIKGLIKIVDEKATKGSHTCSMLKAVLLSPIKIKEPQSWLTWWK